MITLILAFLLAFSVTVLTVPFVRLLSERLGAIDIPNSRKIHARPLPRLGGVSIFIGFLLPFIVLMPPERPFIAFATGLSLIFVVGLVDDIRGLGPIVKLVWQVIAAGVVLAGGIGIISMTDPISGNVIAFDQLRIPMEILGFEFNIIPLANLISVVWIVALLNTVNFLDGMDGLASGIVTITATIIALIAIFALAPTVEEIEVAIIAILLAGACVGFLVFNWHPSSIIMGDSGSYAIGFILAVIAIYGGAKTGVGILVLGVALVDTAWAVMRRIYNRKSIFAPDRGHIHHQLLDSGLTQVQVVLHLYTVAVTIGVAAIVGGFWAAIVALVLCLMATALRVQIRQKKLQR